MQVGDKLSIDVGYAGSVGIRREACEVYAVYPKFVVLTNGKYRFCAFRTDLERKMLISV